MGGFAATLIAPIWDKGIRAIGASNGLQVLVSFTECLFSATFRTIDFVSAGQNIYAPAQATMKHFHGMPPFSKPDVIRFC